MNNINLVIFILDRFTKKQTKQKSIQQSDQSKYKQRKRSINKKKVMLRVLQSQQQAKRMNRNSHKQYQQCPVCYQQVSQLIQLCINEHKICNKCLFQLRKRQCPMCKQSFRIEKCDNNEKNQPIMMMRYQIVFGEQDWQYDRIGEEEDFRQQQQAIRNYERYLEQYQAYRLYYENMYRRYYHNHHHTSHYQSNPNMFYNHEYGHHYHQYHHNNYHHNENQHQQQNRQQHNPQYLQHINQQIRLQRKLRDQQMYRQNLYQSQQQQRQKQRQRNTNNDKQKQQSCGLFNKLGQFFISLGQKLKKNNNNQQNNEHKFKQEKEVQRSNVRFQQQQNQQLNLRNFGYHNQMRQMPVFQNQNHQNFSNTGMRNYHNDNHHHHCCQYHHHYQQYHMLQNHHNYHHQQQHHNHSHHYQPYYQQHFTHLNTSQQSPQQSNNQNNYQYYQNYRHN